MSARWSGPSANPSVTPAVEFFEDPAAFLDVAAPVLEAGPVLATVLATVTRRAVEDGVPGSDAPVWWAAVRAPDGGLVGVAMRTAPVPPHWVYVLAMPADAARALGRALHARGEEVSAVNGVAPAVRHVAGELARLGGAAVRVEERVRLRVLGDLVDPAPVPGRLRAASEADLPLALTWLAAFEADAAHQAGRAPGPSPLEATDVGAIRQRIAQGRLWFWEDAEGRAVHLTGATPSAFGVARVGPVYTPGEQRGRGWASNAVAEVSRLLRAQGALVCLFTDQANPTSNRLYAALGYRPVADLENLRIVAQPR